MADDFSSVLYIEFKAFFSYIKNKNFILDLQKFYALRYKIEMNSNLQELNLKCFTCHSQDHIAIYCPECHYIPLKHRIIDTFNSRKKTFKNVFKRRRRVFDLLTQLKMLNSVNSKNE